MHEDAEEAKNFSSTYMHRSSMHTSGHGLYISFSMHASGHGLYIPFSMHTSGHGLYGPFNMRMLTTRKSYFKIVILKEACSRNHWKVHQENIPKPANAP